MSDESPQSDPPKSFGNMSEHHWSRARAGSNTEALDYYRSRELAPGVREGGAERNFYCMRCDGVIPFDFAGAACPHCAASLAGEAKRYFNWVEINEAPRGDARAVLVPLGLGALALGLVAALVWWWA